MNISLLFLLICSLTAIIGKPVEMEESNDSDLEEAEYESNAEAASEESLNDDKSRQNDPELTHEDDEAKNRDFVDLNEGSYLQRNAAEETDVRFSDYKTSRSRHLQNEKFYDPNNSNDKFQVHKNARQANEISPSHLDTNNYKPSRVQYNVVNNNQDDTIMIEPHVSNEEGNLLYSDNHEQKSKIANSEYNNNEVPDSSGQSQYFKKYYNTMQSENRGIKNDKNNENTQMKLNRDRRQVLESNTIEPVNLSSSQGNGVRLEKLANDDEEAAIKRHIKKLSGEELEDLLNSLSEEKRALLKRIIDNNVESVDGSDNISKREITKKALGENLIENVQSDSSKIQEGSSSFTLTSESSIAHNPETTEISKQPDNQTENNDITSAKNAESNNSENSALNKNDDSKLVTPTDDKNDAELVSDNKVTVKNENKRETNFNDIKEFNSPINGKPVDSDFNTNDLQLDPSDQGCFCSRDEDMSQLLDEEAHLHGNEINIMKRHVMKSDSPDSLRRNLEESFPNSDAYDETGPYSYSGPLIRVKRTNPTQVLKKRAAFLIPNSKVAYVPYRAENEDEDNDEGNEFDDDAFYDRNSHFPNGNIKALEEESTSNNIELNPRESNKNDRNLKANPGNYCKLLKNNNLESDTMSLGTDTDSVLSGVEGVDENLMYSSGVRKKRTTYDDSIPMEIKPVHPPHSTSLLNDGMKSASIDGINAPNYQESDPFGPLPRTYEGDSSRYKRIRGVKETHAFDDTAPSA